MSNAGARRIRVKIQIERPFDNGTTYTVQYNRAIWGYLALSIGQLFAHFSQGFYSLRDKTLVGNLQAFMQFPDHCQRQTSLFTQHLRHTPTRPDIRLQIFA